MRAYRRWRTWTAAALLTMGVLVAGCAGDPPGPPDGTDGRSPTPTPTATGHGDVRVTASATISWGLLVSADGHVLTSSAVVEQEPGEPLEVQFPDGSTAHAQAVAADPRTRLAVIQLDAVPPGAAPAAFADRDVAAGDEVTLRNGQPPDQAPPRGAVTDPRALSGNLSMIATDLADRLGGALYQDQGEVVGILTTFATDAGGEAAGSFAVPASLARRVAEELMAGGPVAHPYLGVAVAETDEGGGAVVRDTVAGSPAAAAGLRPGDVIVEVDGRTVTDPADLVATVQAHATGDQSTITYLRGGTEQRTTVTLVPTPEG